MPRLGLTTMPDNLVLTSGRRGNRREITIILPKARARMPTPPASNQRSPASVASKQLDDSAMYNLVHDVLAAEEERQVNFSAAQASGSDLRRSARKRFSCHQLIAPYDGRRMPSQAEFQPLLCHDLSPTGFSFWQQTPVAASHLIVALGEVPFLFFVAEIVHQDYEPHGEPGGWRIGCRFIRRVDR